jgi:hypothetical protein
LAYRPNVMGWLSSLVLASLLLIAPAKGANPSVGVTPVLSVAAAYQAPPLVKYYKRLDLNQIYQFETSPLGTRTPLILLPGRAEEYQYNAWWKTFFNHFKQAPGLSLRYKPYVYIYNSKNELNTQVQRFVENYTQTHFPRPSVWVSYSLGGVIAREAFLHPAIEPQVKGNIAIAVPFHGSPLFNTEWFSQYLQHRNNSPIRRFSDRLLYRLYLFDKTNLLEGLRWDNMDGSFPRFTEGNKGIGSPQPPVTVYEPFWTTPKRMAAFKKRTIIYTSYLDNPYTGRKLTNTVLKQAETITKDLLTSVVPFDFISVHSVLRYTNLQLSNLPTYHADGPLNNHVYRYNDGVVPLSSGLFLPARPGQPYTEQLKDLVNLSDCQLVRVFKHWDHTEIGEYFAWNRRTKLKDSVHANLEAKTPNDWVFYDLQQLK